MSPSNASSLFAFPEHREGEYSEQDVFKNSHCPLLPTQFLSVFPLQHPEKSSLVPAVTSLSSALLLPQLSSPKDGGAFPSGQDPLRAGWGGGAPGRAEPGRDQAHSSGLSESPAGGCCWKPHCSDERRFLVCVCAPRCLLWLFKSSSQSTYPSLGDFEPVFISEH